MLAAASAGTAVPASAASSQDWPTYLQNVARTAATTDSTLSAAGAPNLKLDWSYTAGGPIATSASVVGTTAYVGAWDGYEYAINTTTGALIWKTSTGVTTDPACNPATLGITSAAAVVNGVVYVGVAAPTSTPSTRAPAPCCGRPTPGTTRRPARTTTGPAR